MTASIWIDPSRLPRFQVISPSITLSGPTVSELAVLRNETEEQTRQFLLDKHPSCNLAMGHFDCLYCQGTGEIARTCSWCDGLGSREAYLDQVWYETLDAMGDRFGMYITHGEGDPCDIFVGMATDLD